MRWVLWVMCQISPMGITQQKICSVSSLPCLLVKVQQPAAAVAVEHILCTILHGGGERVDTVLEGGSGKTRPSLAELAHGKGTCAIDPVVELGTLDWNCRHSGIKQGCPASPGSQGSGTVEPLCEGVRLQRGSPPVVTAGSKKRRWKAGNGKHPPGFCKAAAARVAGISIAWWARNALMCALVAAWGPCYVTAADVVANPAAPTT